MRRAQLYLLASGQAKRIQEKEGKYSVAMYIEGGYQCQT